MKEDLKNILFMGLGAMSLTNDKASKLKEDLLQRGSKLYEEGRVLNEELKHNLTEKIKENVTVVTVDKDITHEDIINTVKNMSEEDKTKLLKELNKKKEK